MSKKVIFIVLVFFAIIAAGCSNKGETESASTSSEGKSKTIEASIENATYMLVDNNNGTSEGETGTLAIDIKVKNVTDSEVNVSPSRSIKLYDGDQELDADSDATYELESADGEIGANKSKDLKVAFTVEKDKKYELAIRPTSMRGEDEEAKLELDTSKYNESFETLEDPAKALTAYIETIYLDVDNADYEKLVSADKAALQDEGKKGFKENINTVFYEGVPDKHLDKFYNGFKSALAEKAEMQTSTLENVNGKAVVSIEYSALPLNDLSEMVREYQQEYLDNKEYDREKANEYALSKFDAMVNKLEIKSGNDMKIKMLQEDGKWTIDTSDYNSEDIVDTFAAGKVY